MLLNAKENAKLFRVVLVCTTEKKLLEQIGELLSITRERVRQLEKATILRLKSCQLTMAS